VRVRTGENQDKFPWQETDRTGLWHFTAPGSGLWLNLGSRTADKTNANWTVGNISTANGKGEIELTQHVQDVRHGGDFDSYLNWYHQEEMSRLMGRAGVKQVVDLRHRNLTAASYRGNRKAACGATKRASPPFDHLHAGWNAIGPSCSGCVDQTEYLNCGQNVPPDAAQAQSLAISSLAPRCPNGSAGFVRSRCKTKRDRSVSFLSYARVADFNEAAIGMNCSSCIHFLWPPAC